MDAAPTHRNITCRGIETVDRCPRGIVPKLIPENERFYFLAGRFLPGLQNGMGGFSYHAIETVFDEFGISGGKRQVLFDRALAVIRAYQDHRREEDEKEELKRGGKGTA